MIGHILNLNLDPFRLTCLQLPKTWSSHHLHRNCHEDFEMILYQLLYRIWSSSFPNGISLSNPLCLCSKSYCCSQSEYLMICFLWCLLLLYLSYFLTYQEHSHVYFSFPSLFQKNYCFFFQFLLLIFQKYRYFSKSYKKLPSSQYSYPYELLIPLPQRRIACYFHALDLLISCFLYLCFFPIRFQCYQSLQKYF